MTNAFSRCAADQRAHDRAWSPVRARGRDGLTRFQHLAESALAAAGFLLGARTVAPVQGGRAEDLYVTGVAGGDARVWLYGEAVELRRGDDVLQLDSRDVRDPDVMIARLVAHLRDG